MKKTLGTLILMSVLSFGVAICSPISQIYKSNPWQYMEYMFVVKPKMRLKEFKHRLIKFGLSSLALGLGGWSGGYIADFLIGEQIKYPLQPFHNSDDIAPTLTFAGFIGTFSAAYLLSTYFIVQSILLNRIEYLILEEFVKDWDANKEATPKELHEFFDSLNKSLKTDSLNFNRQAKEYVFNIKNRIYEKFPEKYKKVKRRRFLL